MGIRVAQIEAEIDGDQVKYRWSIAAEAHSVGLRAAAGGDWVRLGDDMGTPEGAGVLANTLQRGADAIYHRVLAQWNGCQPMF